LLVGRHDPARSAPNEILANRPRAVSIAISPWSGQ
jgi:hypothetical protein